MRHGRTTSKVECAIIPQTPRTATIATQATGRSEDEDDTGTARTRTYHSHGVGISTEETPATRIPPNAPRRPTNFVMEEVPETNEVGNPDFSLEEFAAKYRDNLAPFITPSTGANGRRSLLSRLSFDHEQPDLFSTEEESGDQGNRLAGRLGRTLASQRIERRMQKGKNQANSPPNHDAKGGVRYGRSQLAQATTDQHASGQARGYEDPVTTTVRRAKTRQIHPPNHDAKGGVRCERSQLAQATTEQTRHDKRSRILGQRTKKRMPTNVKTYNGIGDPDWLSTEETPATRIPPNAPRRPTNFVTEEVPETNEVGNPDFSWEEFAAKYCDNLAPFITPSTGANGRWRASSLG
ncbi:hypothetical protein Tco_0503944 [Tanacetum coccineum]